MVKMMIGEENEKKRHIVEVGGHSDQDDWSREKKKCTLWR